jgi:hypothetical protein
MNYFTPERYLRLGNRDNKEQFLASLQEWEDAITAYKDHLEEIRKKLPRALAALIKSVYLHDARVLTMHQDEDRFEITLQPVSTPGQLVVLFYRLVGDPMIKQGVLPAERCREPIEWLYDEIDLERPRAPEGMAPPARGKPTFRHNILLSNGWEVVVRFDSCAVQRPVRVIPIAPTLQCGPGQQTPLAHSTS